MEYDLVIRGGTIVDGSGAPAFPGAVAVKEGRIAAVAAAGEEPGQWQAREVVDAAGMVVSPGFIDMHSHSDWVLPLEDHPAMLAPLVEQGVTTVVAGNCGFTSAPLEPGTPHLQLILDDTAALYDRPPEISWETMGEFLDTMESRGILVNLAMLTGHGNLRYSLFGQEHGHPGPAGMARMKEMIAGSFAEGSFGLSLGLGYAPGLFTDPRELEELAALVREHNRILTVHAKALSRLSGAYPLKPFGRPHNLLALAEAIALAEKTGARLQISHFIFTGTRTWPTMEEALRMLEEARDRGVDVAFDTYPYFCGNTTIYVIYPAWFRRDIERNLASTAARARLFAEIKIITAQLGFDLPDIQLLWGSRPELEEHEGLFFDEIGRRMGCSTFAAYLKVSAMSRGKALCLLHKINGDADTEELYRRLLAHPMNLFETDAILTSHGRQNPAGFGSFPRILGRYTRDQGLLSLEEAVAKMTGYSARRIGLHGRGLLQEGYGADITVFDYRSIRDNATSTDLEAKPSGIKHVFINGQAVVREGAAVPGVLAGKALRAT